MYQINNNDFKILNKFKDFSNKLDGLLENIPRKDYYYKDHIRDINNKLLESILKLSYETRKELIINYRVEIKTKIAEMDFMLERLFTKRYISDRALYKIALDLVEINKMATSWINNKI